jgi:hypothetical protein
MLPLRRASARASGIRKRLAMACLSVIQKHYWKLRLGMVTMFTAIFTIIIGLLTNVRRAKNAQKRQSGIYFSGDAQFERGIFKLWSAK